MCSQVFLEEPAAIDVIQEALQTGTVSSGERKDVLKETPVTRLKERYFQKEAVQSK